MKCHSQWNITQHGIKLKMEFIQIEFNSKWSVFKNEMSLKIECHRKKNVTQNGMSLKIKLCSKWNAT